MGGKKMLKIGGKTSKKEVKAAKLPKAIPDVKQAAEPKKRGRPRKNPLSESSSTRQTDNVNINEFISKHLDRVAKNGLPLATANNGFERGLKPDSVLAAFDDEGQ
ncbi:maker513, partial [Drosophila busckii]